MNHTILMQNRQQALQGRSPRKQGEIKKFRALLWVYRWGWSSPLVIDRIGGSQNRGLASRLVKSGFLRSTRTAAGKSAKGVPEKILTLTPDGVNEVERRLEDSNQLLPYEVNPLKINQQNLRHDLLAQTLTANVFLDGKIKKYLAANETRKKSTKGIKQFDVIWYTEDETPIGIEVELTSKNARALAQFVQQIVQAIETNRVALTFIYSDSKAIIQHYNKQFKAGNKIDIWKVNEKTRVWHISDEILTIPEHIEENVSCLHIDDY